MYISDENSQERDIRQCRYMFRTYAMLPKILHIYNIQLLDCDISYTYYVFVQFIKLNVGIPAKYWEIKIRKRRLCNL